MFATIRHAVLLHPRMSMLSAADAPDPLCYANQATSLTPCGVCTKPATLLDTATGQEGDKMIYTFRHDANGWLCDSNT